MNKRWSSRNESGATLIEVLVGTTIMGLVIGVLATSLVISLKTDQSTIAKFASSHDRQLLANFLVGDAQSASSVGTNAVCSTAETIKLQLHWVEGTTSYDAVYGMKTKGTGGFDLTRTYCVDGVSQGTISILDNVPNVNYVLAYASGFDVALTLTDGASTHMPLTATRRSGTATAPVIGTPPPTSATTSTSTTVAPTTTTTSTTTTTLPSPSTTTSTSLPATTTTTTTTSTTVVHACAGTLTISPEPKRNAGSGKLDDHLTATFTPNAGNPACTGIMTLRFSPASTQISLTATKSGSTWSWAIGKNDYVWTTGTKTFTVNSATLKVAEKQVTL